MFLLSILCFICSMLNNGMVVTSRVRNLSFVSFVTLLGTSLPFRAERIKIPPTRYPRSTGSDRGTVQFNSYFTFQPHLVWFLFPPALGSLSHSECSSPTPPMSPVHLDILSFSSSQSQSSISPQPRISVSLAGVCDKRKDGYACHDAAHFVPFVSALKWLSRCKSVRLHPSLLQHFPFLLISLGVLWVISLPSSCKISLCLLSLCQTSTGVCAKHLLFKRLEVGLLLVADYVQLYECALKLFAPRPRLD